MSPPRPFDTCVRPLRLPGVAWLLDVLAALGLALMLAAPASAARPEETLRELMQGARWPADIARASADYLDGYPRGRWAAEARTDRSSAEAAMRTLKQREVRLYRSDFQADEAPPSTRERIRQAALGDKDAAFEVARWVGNGEAGLPRDMNRYVGWLQYAAALGHGPASYELALHYRRESQPALAAPYEARASELGFEAPPTLDHVRK